MAHAEEQLTDASPVISDPEKRADSSRVTVDDRDAYVPPKTWAVVMVLGLSYGASFFPVPFFSTAEFQIATFLGADSAQGTWLTSCYIAAATIAFMVCGANSDLFGRRWFILGGNILVFVGSIIGGTSHSIGQSIGAHIIIGFGAGNCQLATFAIPELLPNKWRHIGVIIADGVAFFCVIGGPVTARVALAHGDAWRWGYWGTAIAIAISFAVLVLFYFPPKHPRGIAWNLALRNLDWIGIFSFTAAAAMILSGIVYVQLLPASNPKVIGLLVAGFASLVFFGFWETFAKLKEPLAPTRLFTNNKGRTLSAPFVVAFVVTMFYYGTNIVFGTMISTYFTTATTSANTVYWLATVQGFGVLTGGVILFVGGSWFKHWRWQMVISIAGMTLFGGLLAYITPKREGLGIFFAFFSASFFGYAQYLSITYVQFGAEQVELGIAGGLAGVARESGGAIAVTVYQTILANVQSNWAAKHVPAAVEAAGASPKVAQAVLAALPQGPAALDAVQGATKAVINTADATYLESYVHGLKAVSYAMTAFGCLAFVACFFLEDIGVKMDHRIEVFLENDKEGYRNKYH